MSYIKHWVFSRPKGDGGSYSILTEIVGHSQVQVQGEPLNTATGPEDGDSREEEGRLETSTRE